MSIVPGESQRDVRTRPYFRGRAVCSGADTGIGALTTPAHARRLGGRATLALGGDGDRADPERLQVRVRAGSP